MAVLQTLSVMIDADNSRFNRKTDQTKAQAKGTAKSMKSSFGGAATSISAMAGAFLVVAAAAAVAKAAFDKFNTARNEIDEMSKSARRLGVDFKDLQTIRLAAGFAGADSKALETGVQKLRNNLEKAAQGRGSKAFEESLGVIGLTAKELRNLDVAGQLSLIAEKTTQLGTAAEKSSALMGLFGKSGADLGNVFESGAAGIQKAAEESAKLGTITSQETAKVEELNDSIAKVEEAGTRFWQRILIEATKAVPNIVSYIDQIAEAIGSMSDGLTDTGMDMRHWFEEMATYANVFNPNFQRDLSALGLKQQQERQDVLKERNKSPSTKPVGDPDTSEIDKEKEKEKSRYAKGAFSRFLGVTGSLFTDLVSTKTFITDRTIQRTAAVSQGSSEAIKIIQAGQDRDKSKIEEKHLEISVKSLAEEIGIKDGINSLINLAKQNGIGVANL